MAQLVKTKGLLWTLCLISVLCLIGHICTDISKHKYLEVQLWRSRMSLESNRTVDMSSKAIVYKSTQIHQKHKLNEYKITKNTTVALSPEEFYKQGLLRLEKLRKSFMTVGPTFYRKNWAQEYNSYKSSVVTKWLNNHTPPSKHYKFVFGVPTIQRQGVDYLIQTLQSMLANRDQDIPIAIVVLIGEEDENYIYQRMNEIKNKFPKEFDTQLIQVNLPIIS